MYKVSTRNLSKNDFKLLELRLKYDEKLYDFVPTHLFGISKKENSKNKERIMQVVDITKWMDLLPSC